jgi:CDGSH-type Zn-finger protein/truncated hemoglobin YjbI/ferredoxin
MMSQTNPNPNLDRSHIAPVTTREELMYLLARAAELEHSLACVCLFAASSLKHDVSEGGLTDIQTDMVRAWRQRLASAAVDRMRSLAQISNLLTAIDAMPVIVRPALFRPTSTASSESRLTLEPFSQQLLDRLVTYKHLSASLVEPGLAAYDGSESQNLAVNSLTISDLYERLALGFGSMPAEELFIGPKEAQANPHLLGLGDHLVTVVDLESARAALAAIMATGEGVSDGPAAGVFSTIRMEYLSALEDARQTNQPFEPVRPVVVNPGTQPPGETASGTHIVDPFTAAVAELFNGAYDTMLLMLRRFFTHTEETDADLERLARASLRLMTTVIRPLGDALTQMPVDSTALPGRCAGAPFGDDGHIPELVHQTAVWALLDERLWQLALVATKLRVNPGLPTEILEATAALQDLTCQFAPADGPRGVAARIAELKQLQAGLDCTIQSALNGPYLVTNAETLRNWLGELLPTRPQMALCRCGESANKPFCDGTHARIGFTAQKDPKRVPDRRDTYVGTAITVLDNRGICAHSGFCTDRLASVFHVGDETFATPNGARMDEIIRAVRACPSGALSYTLGGIEIRDGVDQARPPTIEVSKDGPYRVTGNIPLKDGQGNDEPRNTGVSLEHYSLCRCGHSQNKPFCSGMHWYVNFHDPQVDVEHEPTLFEWVGGLPVLLRMTHLFYDKYIPQEPLLLPLFIGMSPDHPDRVAAWLGEVFGGPKNYSQQYGGYPRMLSQHVGKHISEAQRERWVNLLCQAADEAGVPADPEFRSAFMAYIEWGSRLAVENSASHAHPPLHMPMPRWDWGTAGPPGSRVSALAPVQEEEKTVVLPSAEEAVRFSLHIKPLFRPTDRQSMKWAFDLWSYQDVKSHAAGILQRLQNGSMPCDGAWSHEQVEDFQRWVESGMQE